MKKYRTTILEAYNRYDPTEYGQCVNATDFIVSRHPELRKKVIKVKYGSSNITHCIAVTKNGMIIDTQIEQFCGAIPTVDKRKVRKGYYTRKEHSRMLPRYRY